MVEKRLILFNPQTNCHGVTDDFTLEIQGAFQARGWEVQRMGAGGKSPTDLKYRIEAFEPRLSLAFNGILPHETLGFLADYIDLPHLAYLLDPPYIFLPLKGSAKTHVACVDANYCPLFQPRSLFLPHAVGKQKLPLDPEVKDIECLFVGSCLDYEEIARHWPGRYGTDVAKMMELAALKVLKEPSCMTLDALAELFGEDIETLLKGSIAGYDTRVIWGEIEFYARGRERIELIRSIRRHPIHVYGGPARTGHRSWADFFHRQRNVKVFGPAPYSEVKKLIRRSRLLLNSVAVFKGGAHERVFQGLLSGTSVLSNDTPFIRAQFPNGMGVIPFNIFDRDSLIKSIDDCLSDESARFQAVSLGKEKVLQEHSWDARVESIEEYLTSCGL